jgi:hypothetical protein
MVTVPKDAFVDRVICIEPTGNIYCQKGLGQVLRRRLKRSGVDLNDQTINQELARKGSIDGSLATLDLSSASDSLCYELVKAVMPPRWFNALNDCRSTATLLPDGTWRHNEKFSSMGNGYTFELESLIFYALLRAVCDKSDVVSVYGDDLIVPNHQAQRCIEALDSIGFKTNESKSFSTGPFRESCGKHYFRGTDVTPVYQKESLLERESNARLCQLYRAYNRLYRWQYRVYQGTADSGNSFSVVGAALQLIRRQDVFRHPIPDGFGDGGFLSSRYPFEIRNGVKRVRHLVERSHGVSDPEGGLWVALREQSSDFTQGIVPVRGRKTFLSSSFLRVP